MKKLIRFLTFWIPVKKWRKKCRDIIFRSLVNRKELKFLNNMYPDSVFFISPHAGIGELTQSLCLMSALKSKIKKNIVVITRKRIEQSVCKLFSKTVSCYCHSNFQGIAERKIPLEIKTGCFYPMYSLPKDALVKRKYDIDFLKDFYHLSQDDKVEHIITEKPNNVSDAFVEIESFIKKNKVILIFPDANTYDSSVISDDVWVRVAEKLEKIGFKCLFNSDKKYPHFKNIFLDIYETVYLASFVSGILTFRSGLSELLAVATECRMLVFYPDGRTHLFQKKCNMSIKAYEDRLKSFPVILDEKLSLTENGFKISSISKNFDRKYCKDYYYNFDILGFENFILQEFSYGNKNNEQI